MSTITDYLLRFASHTSRKARLEDWIAEDEIEGEVYQLPTFCDGLDVEAYTALGAPPVGEDDPGTPPTLATGRWVIVSLGSGRELPAELVQFVKASGAREDGLKLPDGIVGLSTMWAGMKVLSG